MNDLVHQYSVEKLTEKITAFRYKMGNPSESQNQSDFTIDWDLFQNIEEKGVFLIPMILKYQDIEGNDFQIIIESEYRFSDFDEANEERKQEQLYEVLSMSVSYLRHMTSSLTYHLHEGAISLPMINIPKLFERRGLNKKGQTKKGRKGTNEK